MDTWICNEFHEEDTKYDTLFFFTTFSSFFAQSAIHLHHNTATFARITERHSYRNRRTLLSPQCQWLG